MVKGQIKKNNRNFYVKYILPVFSTQSFTPILVFAYIFLVIFFSAINKNFLTVLNFKTILNNSAVLGIASSGVFIVMLAGEFDFSIGAIMSITSVMTVVMFDKNISLPLVILLGLCIGMAMGIVNGLLVAYVGVNSLIVTLATTEIIYGISLIISTAYKKQEIFNETFLKLGRTTIAKIFPIGMIYLIIFIIIMSLVLKFKHFGRNLYTVGGSKDIARVAGLNIRKLKFTTYIISGATASLAGMLLTSQLATGRPEYGTAVMINTVIVCVLGGLVMGGGKGDLLGLFLALIILGSLTSGLYILGVNIYLQKVVSGLMLIVVLVINQYRYRKIV